MRGVSPAQFGLVSVANGDSLVVDCWLQPAGIGGVYRIIVGKCIWIGRRGGTRDQKWIAAREAADGWIVEPSAELGDAQGRE